MTFLVPLPRFIVSRNRCCPSNRVPASAILSESALLSITYFLLCVLYLTCDYILTHAYVWAAHHIPQFISYFESEATSSSANTAHPFRLIPWLLELDSSTSVHFLGKNTRLSCHFLLQGIFPTHGLNLRLLHWQVDSLPLSHQGSPVFSLDNV